MNELLYVNAGEEITDELNRERSIDERSRKIALDENQSENGSDDDSDSIDDEIPIKTIHNFDDLLKLCGDAGVWQIMIFFLGSFFGLNCSMHNLIYLFLAETPDYWCSFPKVDHDQYTDKDLKKLLLKNGSGGCSRYHTTVSIEGTILDVNKNRVEQCNTDAIPIQYEVSDFAETIGTEWSLVCNLSYWIPAVEAIYMVGVLVGSIIFGMLSDKFGRRKTIWVASFMFVFFAPLVALSTNFVLLLIFRFFVGMASPGVYSTAYVLVVESIGPHRRGLAGSLFSIPYSVGYMILPIIAYFVRDWRNLQLTCVTLTPLMLFTWWYLPESPRWLVLKGKVTRAEELLREIARVNGKELPKNFHELVKKVTYVERESRHEITCDERCRNCTTALCKLVHTPIIRCRVICISIAFAAISFVYYGIAISPNNLGFDKYLFTFICGLFEIPTEIVIGLLIERRGRRFVFSGFFLICGTILLASLPLPRGSFLDVIIFVSAQLFIAGNSTLIYLYSSELFPTEIRGYCLGISSMFGRMGSISVPYIVELVGKIHPTYPTIIFGSTALIAGILALLLPETKNKKLPETVKEVERSHRERR